MFDAFEDPKKHCEYFKYLSMIAFSMAVILFTIGSYLVYKKATLEGGQAIAYSIAYALSYFQNRLMYTMCKK